MLNEASAASGLGGSGGGGGPSGHSSNVWFKVSLPRPRHSLFKKYRCLLQYIALEQPPHCSQEHETHEASFTFVVAPVFSTLLLDLWMADF